VRVRGRLPAQPLAQAIRGGGSRVPTGIYVTRSFFGVATKQVDRLRRSADGDLARLFGGTRDAARAR